MTLAEATALIQSSHLTKYTLPQQWVDLGCGSGLFSKALLKLLPPSSKIHAVDTQPQNFNESNIHFHQLNFETTVLPFYSLDGIMMANSLHYIKDKSTLILKLKKHLSPAGSVIIIEYNDVQPNKWVPYPVNFSSLEKLFKEAGFDHVQKLNERPSVYNRGKIYSAYIYNSKHLLKQGYNENHSIE